MKISEELGDLRLALELLWRTGKNAELANSSVISLEHAKSALNSILFILPEKSLLFTEKDKIILNYMNDFPEEFQINHNIDIKKLKSLFYKKSEQFLNLSDKKEEIFRDIIEKFIKLKIFEKYDQMIENSQKLSENTYYLKISPNLILQSFKN